MACSIQSSRSPFDVAAKAAEMADLHGRQASVTVARVIIELREEGRLFEVSKWREVQAVLSHRSQDTN